MRSPSGWAEPGQRPEFDEFTIVLRGALVVESDDGQLTVQAGQAVHARPGEWVRYSTPGADGAEYISVCVPLPSRWARFTGTTDPSVSCPPSLYRATAPRGGRMSVAAPTPPPSHPPPPTRPAP